MYSNRNKMEFRKRFPCRDLLTKNELRHEEETRSGYLTALGNTIITHLNYDLWKVFTLERGKAALDGCFHVERETLV